MVFLIVEFDLIELSDILDFLEFTVLFEILELRL
jgi:hypothetical protein